MADKYSNVGSIAVAQAGIDGVVYTEFPPMASLFDKKALLISRLEYLTSPLTDANLPAAAAALIFGLSSSNNIPAWQLNVRSIVDLNRWARGDFGTAANAYIDKKPYAKDFSQLVGGGIIVPVSPLYLFIASSGAAATMSVECRYWFTVLDLKDSEYYELVEARRLLTV
jgi:hypothetical protein